MGPASHLRLDKSWVVAATDGGVHVVHQEDGTEFARLCCRLWYRGYAGCRMQDAGCRMQDAGCKEQRPVTGERNLVETARTGRGGQGARAGNRGCARAPRNQTRPGHAFTNPCAPRGGGEAGRRGGVCHHLLCFWSSLFQLPVYPCLQLLQKLTEQLLQKLIE